MLYSIGVKTKNTTSEVWIIFIQIQEKGKNKFQNYFKRVVLVGIPQISDNIKNTQTILSKWNKEIE